MFRPRTIGATAAALVAAISFAHTTANAKIPASALLESLPEDVYLVVQARAVPEDDFIENKWRGVVDSFMTSGIMEEAVSLVGGMISANVPTEQTAEITAQFTKFNELFSKIQWKELTDREFVFSMRYGQNSLIQNDRTISIKPPEQVMMFRGSKAAENFDAIDAIFRHIVELTGGIAVYTDKPTTLGSFAGKASTISAPGGGMESVTIALEGDVLRLAIFGDKLLSETLGARTSSIAKSPRFQGAFADLPDAQTTLSFFDVRRLVDGFEGIFSSAMDSAAKIVPPAEADKLKLVRAIMDRAMKEGRTFDHISSVGYVKGNQMFTAASVVLTPGADTSISRIMDSNPSIKSPMKMIPATATGFSVSAGVDLFVIYTEARSIFSEFAPNSAAMLEIFDQQLAQLPIHPINDVLAVFHGGSASVKLAGAMGQNNSATLIAVKDEAKARAAVTKVLDLMQGFAAQANQQITRRAVPGLGEGFESLMNPMLMMSGATPIIGVRDGFLFIGMNEATVKNILETRAGNGENISTNAKFIAQSSVPTAPVRSISWQDTSTMGQEIAMGLTMAGTFGAMGVGANPDVPREVVQLLQLLPRIGQIVGQIDFIESKSATTIREGNTIRTTTITTYKKD